MRIFSGANFDFLGSRKRAYFLSGAVILAGITAMVVNVATLGSWMRYGVDFTGGTIVQVRTAEGITVADLREALGDAVSITRFGTEDEFKIRATLDEDEEDADNLLAASDAIRTGLTAGLGEGTFEIVQTDLVGPTIGDELEQKAFLAIGFSLIAILLYIAVRFEMRFGLAMVLAATHDILLTLGVLALFRIEISLTIVAAVLTILGYSMNDKVVVFDRIRENLGKKGGRRDDQMALINRSINETLPRTVITSATTLVVLFALLLLGGAVVRDFAMILILGILAGTYSSIFLACPALLEIQKRWGTKEAADAKKDRTRNRSRSKSTATV
jgi:preprotein translocase subunit SecF